MGTVITALVGLVIGGLALGGLTLGALLVLATDSPAAAQEPDAANIISVLRGPGGIGYWVVNGDGTVEVVGTGIMANFEQPPELEHRVVGARAGVDGALGVWLQLANGDEIAIGDPGPAGTIPIDVPPGRLVGVSTSFLLAGFWWPDVDVGCTAELPLEVRVGQTILAALGETQLGSATDAARRHGIGGIVINGNVTEHVWRRIDELQDFAAPVPLMLAVDEEGGRVQRLRYVLDPLPSAQAQTDSDIEDVEDLIADHARQMADLGFTVNFAPVVDVGGGPGIGDRAFSDDPSVVIDYAQATVDGLSLHGVLPVLKHFPGHGAVTADTHHQLAMTEPIEVLNRRDLVPFASLLSTNEVGVMVGHLDVPGLTDGIPASLSKAAVTDLLRTELGHDGLVVTDSLIMGAVTDRFTVSRAAVMALNAGVDLAMVGGLSDVSATTTAIGAAVADGTLSVERLNAAATNVLRAKGIFSCSLVDRVDPDRRLGYDPSLVAR